MFRVNFKGVGASPIPSDCCSSSRYGCHRTSHGPFAALAAQTMSSVSDWASWVSDWIPLVALNIRSNSYGGFKKVYTCHPSLYDDSNSIEYDDCWILLNVLCLEINTPFYILKQTHWSPIFFFFLLYATDRKGETNEFLSSKSSTQIRATVDFEVHRKIFKILPKFSISLHRRYQKRLMTFCKI